MNLFLRETMCHFLLSFLFYFILYFVTVILYFCFSQGPAEDEEPEMEQTVTELKAAAAKRLEKLEKLESGEIEEEDRERKKREALQGKDVESGGIDWGMGKAVSIS